MADDSTKASGFSLKISGGIGVIVFLITLAIWIFFDVEDMRLDPVSTTVVATAVSLVAVSVEWIWSHRRRNKGAKSSEPVK
jgi:hypothetical protein